MEKLQNSEADTLEFYQYCRVIYSYHPPPPMEALKYNM